MKIQKISGVGYKIGEIFNSALTAKIFVFTDLQLPCQYLSTQVSKNWNPLVLKKVLWYLWDTQYKYVKTCLVHWPIILMKIRCPLGWCTLKIFRGWREVKTLKQSFGFKLQLEVAWRFTRFWKIIRYDSDFILHYLLRRCKPTT